MASTVFYSPADWETLTILQGFFMAILKESSAAKRPKQRHPWSKIEKNFHAEC
jgi:hypothetical protein